MTTIILTSKQLDTIERALGEYLYDLHENFERNEVQEDEIRLVRAAIDALGDQGTWAIVDGLNQRID